MAQSGMVDVRDQSVRMMVSSVVQLVNEGTTTFNMRYGPTQRLIIGPGESLFVNEDVAWHFLGRWWTDDKKNPKQRDRTTEYQRLRTLYGAYEDDVLWEQNRPRLVAYAPDGQRITSVVDDPEGMDGRTFTQVGKEMSLESQLSVLQETVLALQAQLGAQGQRNAADAQEAVAYDVTPPAAPGLGTAPSSLQVAGVPVPTAPAPFITPPEESVGPMDEPGPGARLAVKAAVAFDPSEQAAPEDAPNVMAQGPSPTGGRIAAE